MTADKIVSLGDALRHLADLVDSDDYLADVFLQAQFGTHLFGEDSLLFDAFINHFGGERVQHGEDRPYKTSQAEIGPLTVWCQTYLGDYELAKREAS